MITYAWEKLPSVLWMLLSWAGQICLIRCVFAIIGDFANNNNCQIVEQGDGVGMGGDVDLSPKKC
jgi:hypothetical protein